MARVRVPASVQISSCVKGKNITPVASTLKLKVRISLIQQLADGQCGGGERKGQVHNPARCLCAAGKKPEEINNRVRGGVISL